MKGWLEAGNVGSWVSAVARRQSSVDYEGMARSWDIGVASS